MRKINVQIEAEIEVDDETFALFEAAEAKDEFLGKRLESEEGITIQHYNVEHQVLPA